MGNSNFEAALLELLKKEGFTINPKAVHAIKFSNLPRHCVPVRASQETLDKLNDIIKLCNNHKDILGIKFGEKMLSAYIANSLDMLYRSINDGLLTIGISTNIEHALPEILAIVQKGVTLKINSNLSPTSFLSHVTKKINRKKR